MEQRILDVRLQMEILISEREGMIAENMQREYLGQSMAYDSRAFDNISIQLSMLISVLRA